jgi:hypothetical protein
MSIEELELYSVGFHSARGCSAYAFSIASTASAGADAGTCTITRMY